MKHGIKHEFGKQCPKCVAANPDAHKTKRRKTSRERKEARKASE